MKKDYIKPVYDKSLKVLSYANEQVYELLETSKKIPLKSLEFFNKTIEITNGFIYDYFNKDTRLAKLLRYVSYPTGLLIPVGYRYIFHNRFGRALLYVPGVHMIRASVGGGKSLTSLALAELYLEETGRGSYFTSPVERPQVTKDGKFLYVNHRVIDTKDYYKDGKKVMNYNTNKYKVIHKDERHLDYNPRLNNTRDYKDRFIPEQKDEILMRHEGFTHIYKYSQYFKLDSQDMQALTYMHEVKTIKDIPVKRWLDTGKLEYIPTVLKFDTYKINFNFDGSMKRKKVGSCKIKIPYELLLKFDTHAESKRYAGLPLDFK